MEQDRSVTCELVLKCCAPGGDSTIVGEVYAVLRKEILRRQCVNHAANLGRKVPVPENSSKKTHV